jgi:hypothetical protein
MQRFEEVELLAVRAQLWRMEIEILREIHRYRFAKRGRRFGSDVELMIVYGAAMLYYGSRMPVRALPISRFLEMPRETVRRQVDWWRSACLNAQRIRPSRLPMSSVRLRSSGRYDYSAAGLSDYCDCELFCRRLRVDHFLHAADDLGLGLVPFAQISDVPRLDLDRNRYTRIVSRLDASHAERKLGRLKRHALRRTVD